MTMQAIQRIASIQPSFFELLEIPIMIRESEGNKQEPPDAPEEGVQSIGQHRHSLRSPEPAAAQQDAHDLLLAPTREIVLYKPEAQAKAPSLALQACVAACYI